ncbi:MAG: ABC transporter permease, partial [Anaerolineae bacterium]
MRKILIIAGKELYTTYTDLNALLLMLLTPLALALIIGFALGGLGGDSNGSDIPIADIPVGVVNLDEGSSSTDVNYGSVFVDLLVPGEGSSGGDALPECEAEEDSANGQGVTLEDLTEGVRLDDPAEARRQVDSGDLIAAIIIPADFTERIGYGQNDPVEPVSLEVYATAAAPISSQVVRSIAEGIATQIAVGTIAIESNIDALVAEYPQVFASGDFDPDFNCAFTNAYAPLSVEQETLSGESQGGGLGFNPLVYFGAANAIFFMMFTAQAGANDILREQRQWTLQRLLISPTPRIQIMLGKLVGTFLTCVFQIIILFAAFTLVASIADGELSLIFGTNWGAIILVILAAALAAAGLGTLINGFVRTPEQGNVIGSSVIVLMGLLGGT